MSVLAPYPHTVLVGPDRRVEGEKTTWHWRCGCGAHQGGYVSERRCRDDGLFHQQAHTRGVKEERIPRVYVVDEDGTVDGRRPTFNDKHFARFIVHVIAGRVIVAKAVPDMAEDIVSGDFWRMP